MKTTLQELDDKYLVTFDGDLDTAAAVEVYTQVKVRI